MAQSALRCSNAAQFSQTLQDSQRRSGSRSAVFLILEDRVLEGVPTYAMFDPPFTLAIQDGEPSLGHGGGCRPRACADKPASKT